MKRIYKHKISLLLTALFLTLACLSLSKQQLWAQSAKSSENMVITNQERTLTIYPMPATNFVHIRISPALRTEIDRLEIISLIGRKMNEQQIIDPNTIDITFTNLNQYPGGVYMVIAKDKYGKIVKSAKMVIDR